MADTDPVEASLTDLVDSAALIGYVAGFRKDGRSKIVVGGACDLDGTPMRRDTLFPLSSNSKPIGGVLALRLVELGVLGLDAPVSGALPELAEPRVLAAPGADPADTVAAQGPITLRHLLTMTAGVGWVDSGPLAQAMSDRGIAPGPYAPRMSPDEFLCRLGELPLAGQPGAGWNYHTASDVLGVLLERVTGARVADLLAEYVTGPLGMTDTGFTADLDRLTTSYGPRDDGGLERLATADRFATTPDFDSLACGLVSTIDDYLVFLDVLRGETPALSAEAAKLMCSDHLTATQRESAAGFIEAGCGYGFQVEVRPGGVVGWAGGLGTIGYVDRESGRSAAVFVPQFIDTPGAGEALETVWDLLS